MNLHHLLRLLTPIACWLLWLAIFVVTLGWLVLTTAWGVRRRHFLASAILVALLWIAFLLFPPSTPVDAVVVGIVGISYIINWAQMLIYRRRWSLRAIGIFWTIFADSLYWSALLASLVFGIPLPGLLVPLILAAFIVGAPTLDIGTIGYLRRRDASAES